MGLVAERGLIGRPRAPFGYGRDVQTDGGSGGPDDMAPFIEFLGTLGVAPSDVPDDPVDAAAMAADVVFTRGDTMSMRDLADGSGLTLDEAAALFRYLGVRVDDPNEIMFSAQDLSLCEFLRGALGPLTPDEARELLNVLGASLASIAEAAVSAHVQGPEARVENYLEGARLNAAMGELGLGMGVQLAAVFRHHLRQSSLRQRRTQSLESRAVVELTIGFVDLVGFTPLSQTLDPARIVGLVTTFESRAHELAHDHSVRVVKLIGDEVMFAAEHPAPAAAFALGMIETFGSDEVVPRGGLAAGPLVTVHGDYFGPVVNLASRLVGEAVPGEILVDEIVAADVPTEPAGRRMLKGFETPVSVHTLTPS